LPPRGRVYDLLYASGTVEERFSCNLWQVLESGTECIPNDGLRKLGPLTIPSSIVPLVRGFSHCLGTIQVRSFRSNRLFKCQVFDTSSSYYEVSGRSDVHHHVVSSPEKPSEHTDMEAQNGH
ncbi:hypothetical protein B0H17DRAFT_1028430, partial [Mycena rosella]